MHLEYQLTMATCEISKDAHKIIFFKKEGCAPCDDATAALDSILYAYPEYRDHVHVFQKEHHTSLVETYELEVYPVALLLDFHNDELGRVQGSRWLNPKWWKFALNSVHLNNKR